MRCFEDFFLDEDVLDAIFVETLLHFEFGISLIQMVNQ